MAFTPNLLLERHMTGPHVTAKSDPPESPRPLRHNRSFTRPLEATTPPDLALEGPRYPR
jgi:hypothetical protein